MSSKTISRLEQHTQRSAHVDPITTEVVRHALSSAGEQMSIALQRTAFSPIIHDSLDFCCALYDREMRLLAQGVSLPSHFGGMDYVVRASVEAIGGVDELLPGDVLMNSYGYEIGSHSQDLATVAPIFLDELLVGYAAVRAHQMDMGAKAPYCSDTTDNFQEGVIFPGVHIYRAGERQDAIYRTLLANSRWPKALAGDLDAQLISMRTGSVALTRLIEKYGLRLFTAATERMFDHGEALVRAFIESIPDGRYVGRCVIDNDGISDDPVPFEVSVVVSGSTVVIDHTAAPPMVHGPINVPLPKTVCLARLAIITLAVRGREPVHHGQFRPIEVWTTPGTLFHATPPAPLYLCPVSAYASFDAIHRALADVLPEVPAGTDDCTGLVLWGAKEDGRSWADGFGYSTGPGATAAADGGPPLIHIGASGLLLASSESIELRNPLIVRRLELREDSSGAGQFRGGLGIAIDYEMTSDTYATCLAERMKAPPWGLNGGKAAAACEHSVVLPDGTERIVTKTTAMPLPRGTLYRMRSGGGGGYGPPEARDPESVHRDVHDGYLSESRARTDYPHAFDAGTVEDAPSGVGH